jgi:hypothetical protein
MEAIRQPYVILAGLYQVLSVFLQTTRGYVPADNATGKTAESGVRDATVAVNNERTNPKLRTQSLD